MRKEVKEEVFKHHPKLSPAKKIILSLPAVLSLSWVFYLGSTQQTFIRYGAGGELLAPTSTTPLMLALILFTIGYILFLLLMFSENIKEFFGKRVRH